MMKEILPPWQMGYDIEYLRGICSPFKTMHKPLVYGAFGLTKERDVAGALKEGRCCYNAERTACLIWKHLKRGSVKRDYSGRKIQYPKGSLLISNFASTNIRDGSSILENVIESSEIDRDLVYVEIFEEDEVARAIIKSLDCLWLTSKITAGSEVIGIYKFHNYHWDFPVSHHEKELLTLCDARDILGYNYRLSTKDTDLIRGELSNYAKFEQHYSHYNKRNSWLAFSVKGYKKDDPGFIIKPMEMSKKWKSENRELLDNSSEWTVISDRFPATVNFVKQFGKIDRVRFMKLLSGGELSRHADITDRDAGVSSGKVARFHLPIISRGEVVYNSWNLRGEKITKEFKEGRLYYLDQRKPHRVVNDSPIDRINLVMDIIL